MAVQRRFCIIEKTIYEQLGGTYTMTKLWQFEYRPMSRDEPGLIEFTVRERKPVAHCIEKVAQGDTADLRFGREAVRLICRSAKEVALPKKAVLILPDSDLMPRSYP